MYKLTWIIIFIFISCWSFSLFARTDDGVFSGRISRTNQKAEFVRIKSTFNNLKYVNKRDKLIFWGLHNSALKCEGHVLGKGPQYILVKVRAFKTCERLVSLASGKYLMFSSTDLKNNILMGKELIKILVKKQVAVKTKLHYSKQFVETHGTRINAVNGRYDILRRKLQAEWKRELSALEEDQTTGLHNMWSFEMRLNEIDYKLRQYRVEDENLEEDRWALDSRLYYRK